MEFKDARKLKASELTRLRLRVVDAVRGGASQTDAARRFCVSRASVNAWIGSFRTHGADGLRSRDRGRPRSRNRDYLESLLPLLLNKCPYDVGLPDPLWSWRSISRLIELRFGAAVSRWTICRQLDEWGITPKGWQQHTGFSRTRKARNSGSVDGVGRIYRLRLHRLIARGDENTPMEYKSIVTISTCRSELWFVAIDGQFNSRHAVALFERVLRIAHPKKVLLVDLQRRIYKSKSFSMWSLRNSDKFTLVQANLN